MRSFLLCVALAVTAMLPVRSLGAAAPVPIEDFFQAPRFRDAQLSPDGKQVAMLMANQDGRIVLAVMPTAGGRARTIAAHQDRDLTNLHWINNERLVYSYLNPDATPSRWFTGGGLYAINKDGSQHVQLVAHGPNKTSLLSPKVPNMPWNTHFLKASGDPASNEVYVVLSDTGTGRLLEFHLFVLNTIDGNARRVAGPQHVTQWMIDEAGQVSAATSQQDGLRSVHLRDPASGQWRKLTGFAPGADAQFLPFAKTRDGVLLVLANNGRDTEGLYQYDMVKQRMDAEPVVGLARHDFRGELVFGPDRSAVLGVRYETSEPVTTWFDPAMQAIQARVDQLLPATINRLIPARDRLAGPMLVYSHSDLDPGFWQLYEPASETFTRLGVVMPGISPLDMSPKRAVRYTARDGLEIPAYLTLPKGRAARDLPLVVLVHGGPWVRGGHLRWSPDSQLLASRGYAVLEPDFRGSTGYGRKHFRAGWKQWGQAMQDDLADAARWAIAQGTADPKRICIAGASYGGYATLMGLAKNPELFRCGVDWVGVTDLPLLSDSWDSDLLGEARDYILPLLIGNRETDAAMLTANSPVAQAGRITQPLLMAYGGIDRRVPIEHGKRFYQAVKAGNPDVEWIEYADEGHGWFMPKTNIDFWQRVERFLDRNIGKAK